MFITRTSFVLVCLVSFCQITSRPDLYQKEHYQQAGLQFSQLGQSSPPWPPAHHHTLQPKKMIGIFFLWEKKYTFDSRTILLHFKIPNTFYIFTDTVGRTLLTRADLTLFKLVTFEWWNGQNICKNLNKINGHYAILLEYKKNLLCQDTNKS